MQLFKDKTGQEWTLDFNIASAKKLNARLKEFNVSFMKPETILNRITDILFMADLLYLACKDQADERKMTDEDFGRALSCEVLFYAQKSFLKEYIEFFPDPTVQKKFKR